MLSWLAEGRKGQFLFIAIILGLIIWAACQGRESRATLNERMDEFCQAAYVYLLPDLDWINLPTGPAVSRLHAEMFETYELWDLSVQACDAWYEVNAPPT